MSILITGGTGSLGACLARALLDEGLTERMVLFDDQPNRSRVAEFADRVEIVSGNIADWPDVVRAVKDYDIQDIFHLAALLFTESMERPYAAFKVNLEGTVNVLEAARVFGVKKMIFASTIATFGPGLPEPVKEGAPQVPGNLYGITKLAGELFGLYYHRQYGLDFRALRFARIVNAGRSGTGTALFPSSLIEDAIRKKPHQVTVPKDYRVPITYIKDAARALVMLYRASEAKTRIYHINGMLPGAKEIVDRVKTFLPDAVLNFAESPAAPPLAMPLTYDDTRAFEEFGYKMKYDLDAMISDFISELRAEGSGGQKP